MISVGIFTSTMKPLRLDPSKTHARRQGPERLLSHAQCREVGMQAFGGRGGCCGCFEATGRPFADAHFGCWWFNLLDELYAKLSCSAEIAISCSYAE